ncbi:MAG: helix-turn-helix transcriptional regulator [Nitrospirota bacterium]
MKHSERLQAAFGKAMRGARMALGISQEELAARAQLHRTYVGDIERGKRNLSLVNMVKVAEALGKKLSDLVRDMERHLRKSGVER